MVKTRAVRIREPGGPEVLEIVEGEQRPPGPTEVLVEVAASGLNRADTLQRRGFYPAPVGAPSDIPGLEFAGLVAEVGEEVHQWQVGDPVMGIVAGGGMATHLVVSSRELLPVPKGMSPVDAAAIPEVFVTAFDGLFRQGELALGETVLLHAVASGVGTAAIQLARQVGATVVGTSRTESKLQQCQEAHLGLDHAVVARDKSFAAAVSEVVGEVDLIFDPVGAAYLTENLAVLRAQGRLVVYGLMGGVKGEIPLSDLLRKRLRVRGTVLRSRSLEEKATLIQQFRAQVLPLFERGELRTVVDRVAPMSEVSDAHRYMESNRSFGKIVLRW